jgi:hypothetical protein
MPGIANLREDINLKDIKFKRKFLKIHFTFYKNYIEKIKKLLKQK